MKLITGKVKQFDSMEKISRFTVISKVISTVWNQSAPIWVVMFAGIMRRPRGTAHATALDLISKVRSSMDPLLRISTMYICILRNTNGKNGLPSDLQGGG